MPIAIVTNLAPQLASGDVVAILSNGGFDGIYEKLPAALKAAPAELIHVCRYRSLHAPGFILGIPVAHRHDSMGDRQQAMCCRSTAGLMWVVRTGLHLAGIRVEAVWEQPLDLSQHYLFLSNHVSNLDPPVLLPLLPERSSAFLKRSLMKIPILGWGMRGPTSSPWTATAA